MGVGRTGNSFMLIPSSYGDRLLAEAKARGQNADALVREALDLIVHRRINPDTLVPHPAWPRDEWDGECFPETPGQAHH
jgi:hypothetical protein